MKTLMNNKYAYLMAVAVLAGSLGFTACNSDEGNIDPINGPKKSVSLGFSVVGLESKATADGVNLGTTLQPIKNIIVAPMVKGEYSNTIKFPELNPSTVKTVSKVVNLITTVDQFRVYGNLPATINPAEGSAFPGFTFTPENVSVEVQEKNQQYMNPYPLLYFGDTNPDGFYAATITNTNWTAATWGNSKVTALGANNAIKIDGVKYAVGVMGVGVLESAKMNKNEAMFFDVTDIDTDGVSIKQNATGKSMNELITNGTTAFFKVAGITVAGQSDSFTHEGKFATSHTKVVYETAAAQDLLKNKIATQNTGNVVTLPNANVYCVVSPTIDAEIVTLNLRIQNVSGKVLKMNDGGIVKDKGYFFLGATLDKSKNVTGTAASVFAPATTTVANLTVTDWGKGTTKPQEFNEITLGIEVDMSWTAGLVFDQEI